MVVKRHSALAAAIAACFLLAATSSASAATRYATVGGSGPAPCLQTNPCPLPTAVTAALAGDTVSVAPGTYPGLAGLTNSNAGVEIAGEPGGTKPVLQLTGLTSVSLTGTGSKLRNVAIEAPAAFQAVAIGANGLVSDVDVSTAGTCITLAGTGSTIENSKLTTTGANPAVLGSCISGFPFSDGTTVRNVEAKSTATAPTIPGPFPPATLVALLGSNITIDRLVATNPAGGAVVLGSTAPGGLPSVMRRSRLSAVLPAVTVPSPLGNGGVTMLGDTTVTDTLVTASGPVGAVEAGGGKLRNVTAIATGAGSRGLHVGPQFLGSAAVVSVKNSIFRGDGADVAVEPVVAAPIGCIPIPPTTCGSAGGDLTITYSNFRSATGPVNGASGNNQSADPLFTAADDFHPKAGSPAIDAGVDDASNGPKDLDGRDRKIGSAVDIGAYEFDPPPAPPAQPAQPSAPQDEGTPVIVTPPPVIDHLAPLLGKLAITNKTFKVGKSATAVAARAKTGTVFVYSLTEPSTVSIAVQQATPGKRKGSSCVKPTHKLAKAKKCTLYKAAGTLTRGGIAGTNAVPFSGRIGTKALKPGSYRAVFSAVDLAGNKAAKTPSVSFKVVKK
jgi:hypothetical protein